jgi:hypothetical protein
MFIIETDIKDLKVKERNMVKAFFSMNNHQVATPEMMSEEARSYIILFREADGKMSAYIGIHLLLTGRKLFYSHTSNPFSERDLNSVEEEARTFAEGLGAMLDEVNLSTMTRDAKEHWIDAQEIFISEHDKSVSPAVPVMTSPTASVAETLVIPQQQPKLQPEPPGQSVEQIHQAQPLPASAVPQSSQAQQIQSKTVPSLITDPSSPMGQRNQEQSVLQHNLSEPIVHEPQTTPALVPPKSQKTPAEKAAPAARAKEEIREFPERANTKAAHASTLPKERLNIIQEAIKAGIVKPAKSTLKKDVKTSAGVVSRDREALARLLASF